MSHRYYSPLRPLSLGTFPKPQGNEILHIENFEERQNVQEIARQAWGYIEYKEALTEIEAAAYELIPSNCISEMENIPRKDYKRRNHSGKMDKENIRNHYKRAAKAGVFF